MVPFEFMVFGAFRFRKGFYKIQFDFAKNIDNWLVAEKNIYKCTYFNYKLYLYIIILKLNTNNTFSKIKIFVWVVCSGFGK